MLHCSPLPHLVRFIIPTGNVYPTVAKQTIVCVNPNTFITHICHVYLSVLYDVKAGGFCCLVVVFEYKKRKAKRYPLQPYSTQLLVVWMEISMNITSGFKF